MKRLATVLMISALAAVGLQPIGSAQSTPQRIASTYRPGYWQPLGRVNPNRSIQVTIMNRSKEALKYSLLNNLVDKSIAPGSSAHVNFSAPLFLNLNASGSQGLGAKLLTEGNRVVVDVYGTPTPGFRVVNIDDAGSIYLY
jgi:hypothetical protein